MSVSRALVNVKVVLNRKFKNWSMLACVYRVMDARGKFGEHERSIRVARGAAERNSSFSSALQTSQVQPWLDIRMLSMNQFFSNIVTTTTKKLSDEKKYAENRFYL